MTEQDWLACTDPKPMLVFVRGKISDRKRRLFAVACCRRISDLFWEDWMGEAVDVAERYADGQATQDEMTNLSSTAREGYFDTEDDADEVVYGAVWSTGDFDHEDEVEMDDFAANAAAHVSFATEDREGESRFQCDLLRDILGPLPFRPIAIDPARLAWNDRTIPKLAQSIYDDRAFDRLPILADALEEAGCNNADILSHCRSEGPHVRGCWVIDLILGKS